MKNPPEMSEEAKNGSTRLGSRKSLLQNSVAILISRLITVAVSLVSVPIVISHLGFSGYGVWESIIAFSVLCSMGQATISGTLLWKFSGAFGSKDYSAAYHYVRIGVFASLSLFCIVTPIAWWSRQHLVSLFHVPVEFRLSAEMLLPAIVALMLLGSINEIIGALLSGFQRSGIVNLVQSVSSACNYSVVVVGLLMGLGLWSLMLGYLASFLASLGALYGVARWICGPVSLAPQVPSLALIRSLTGYTGFMLLQSVTSAFRDQTDRIVLAAVASPIWTGYFAIAARLTALVWMVCQFLYVPLIAASGALAAREDWVGVQRLYADSSRMLSVTVGLLSVVIAALHDRFLVVWLGHPVVEAQPIIYLLLLGSTVAIVLSGVGTAVCKGIGIVRIEAFYTAVGLIINLILKFALIPWLGFIGTVVASSASMVISVLLFLFLMHKRLPQLPWASSLASVKTLLAALCSMTMLHFALPSYSAASGRAAALLSLCSMIPFVAAVYSSFLLAFRVITIRQMRHFAHLLRSRYQ